MGIKVECSVLLCLTASLAAAQTVSLQVSSATARAGTIFPIYLTLNSSTGTPPAALQWDVIAPSGVTVTTEAAGAAAVAGGKTLSCSGVRCLAWGLNSNAIPDGTVAVLSVSLSSAASGSLSVQLANVFAASPGGSSVAIQGQAGAITVYASTPPSVVSVAPNSGSGASQAFSFAYSDPNGYAAIISSQILINNPMTVSGGCYLLYYRPSNAIYLANDAGTAWQNPLTLGQSGTLQNSQCAVNASGSSASGSGNSLTLNVMLSFQPAFYGTKNIYAEVYDGPGDSGWQQRGTWTVPSAGVPAAVSVTPSSGGGASQTFSFAYSDPGGYAAIVSSLILINNPMTTSGGCYLLYSRSSNSIYLTNDAGTAWQTPVTLGQSGTLQNSQCSANPLNSSASGSGNNLTLNLALTFQAAFGGTKNIYMEVSDGAGDSGWQQRGSWTVPASGPPATISVTPASGSGSSQTFSFVFSDPAGYSAIVSSQILINNPMTASGGCYLLYSRSTNSIYLTNDAGTAWQTPVTPGQSGTLQNSQCSVNPLSSTASGSGNNLTLNLAITFQTAFGGAKNTYMEVYDGAGDSGWQQRGSWTVPSAGAPAAVSVTPSSGSGASQTFTFAYSDPDGFAALVSSQILINNPMTASGGCYLLYSRSTNSIYLTNDAGTVWQNPVTLGQSGTLRNSQCSVNPLNSSASSSGNNLTLNLAITFQTAFGGAKNTYMEVSDGAGDSGWQQRGSWTVPASGPPATVSVTPASGSGSSQSFAFAFSDPAGYSAIVSAQLLLNNPMTTSGGCYLLYYRPNNAIYLTNDAGTAWQNPVTLGQTGTLQNSQCSVNPLNSSASGSGNNLTVNLTLTFKAGFSGTKSIYTEVYDGVSDSGWQQWGTWTVP
ncbi:MAG TPA: hypothetical protein VE959_03050 [Bryobacteraceae bacterium]|nr:hypothetical protein [Bryobacteraceae bacterium]